MTEPIQEDDLVPYFWGFNVNGDRLVHLDEILHRIDDVGPQTEVDLFLLGHRNLVLIEAKHLSHLGRCSRFGRERCPEIHQAVGQREAFCRYWEQRDAQFARFLNFGERPEIGASSPPCNQHYQLGRTFLVGRALGQRLNRKDHLWMVLPRARWTSLERAWLDFSERILDEAAWRRLRVLAWEDIIE
ncbi:MAG: hypothetical protein GTO14_25810 [Anaerolineales bacterium]|nr:hypothetical protein [Anaerolineales bacterium]